MILSYQQAPINYVYMAVQGAILEAVQLSDANNDKKNMLAPKYRFC